MPDIVEIDAKTAKNRLDAGAIALDVREQHEWDAGHIDGAVHIPLTDLPDRVDEVEDRDNIVAVCLVGARSAKAARVLASNGIEAVNLVGGMRAWHAAGLSVVTSDGSPGRVVSL